MLTNSCEALDREYSKLSIPSSKQSKDGVNEITEQSSTSKNICTALDNISQLSHNIEKQISNDNAVPGDGSTNGNKNLKEESTNLREKNQVDVQNVDDPPSVLKKFI